MAVRLSSRPPVRSLVCFTVNTKFRRSPCNMDGYGFSNRSLQIPWSRLREASGRLNAAQDSAADIWSWWVVSGSLSPRDLYTLSLWCRYVGASYTTLRNVCHIAGEAPLASRDFMRMLRACERAATTGSQITPLLRVKDARTATRLLVRAGCRDAVPTTVSSFVSGQQLVSPRSHAVNCLMSLLGSKRVD